MKREFVESLRKRLSAEEFTLLLECLDRELELGSLKRNAIRN